MYRCTPARRVVYKFSVLTTTIHTLQYGHGHTRTNTFDADGYFRTTLGKEMSDHHPMFGTDPGPFNLDARPGFGKELSRLYTEWSNAHPNHSRIQGMEAHKTIALSILHKFPTHRELANEVSIPRI